MVVPSARKSRRTVILPRGACDFGDRAALDPAFDRDRPPTLSSTLIEEIIGRDKHALSSGNSP